MTLFQFLRYVLDVTPIALFDVSGSLIKKYKSKQDIDFNLLDYEIFRISAAPCREYGDNDSYLCICLRK